MGELVIKNSSEGLILSVAAQLYREKGRTENRTRPQARDVLAGGTMCRLINTPSKRNCLCYSETEDKKGVNSFSDAGWLISQVLEVGTACADR